MVTRTAYRTCPLCEATCGLRVELDGGRAVSVRGGHADVLSGGFVCPKGVALGALHDDPDRLSTPLARRDGALQPVCRAAAFALRSHAGSGRCRRTTARMSTVAPATSTERLGTIDPSRAESRWGRGTVPFAALARLTTAISPDSEPPRLPEGP